jgi:glycosyltransferase involved in cell wall biosynthesis
VKLSIVICAYNERSSILSVLDRTLHVELPAGWKREIILVDNASTDGTQDLLRAVKGPGIKVIFHPRNLGKGASIRTGFGHATGDYVVIQDADTEYDPADLAPVLQKAIETDADAVFGSRVAGGHASYHYATAYWGVRVLTWATNLLCGSDLTDVAVATKMVRTSILPELALRGEHFDLDFELPVKLLRAGYRIYEVPVSYRPRTYEEGKKIKPLDGLRAFWVILRERFR